MNNIKPSVEQRKLLDLHLKLVMEINTSTNLTRIIDWNNGQLLHIEDSLSGLPEINEAPSGKYLDMGSGAGFPGIPVAIMTQRKTMLADSVGKKIKALDTIINQLGMDDSIQTYHGRVETLAEIQPENFTVITARALSSLASLLELASPLLCKGGSLICYKSQDITDELTHTKEIAGKLGMSFHSRRDLCLSDNKTKRSILVFNKVSQPELSLPRRVGLAQKKPL